MTNNLLRCRWCLSSDLYVQYHDKEWGELIKDDKTLFEFLVLESAQAGLSWITILKKREGYRKEFANFEIEKVALFTALDEERLANSSLIVKNKLKIRATISNAKLFMQVQQEFGSFYNYLWSFMPQKTPIINHWDSFKNAPTKTTISDNISADMKKRGFKFFGTTICYAFMQAVGMVNDHEKDCFKSTCL